ncbi:MAG: hypothetical protein AB7T49_15615 [Oligoflexales bacterium]
MKNMIAILSLGLGVVACGSKNESSNTKHEILLQQKLLYLCSETNSASTNYQASLFMTKSNTTGVTNYDLSIRNLAGDPLSIPVVLSSCEVSDVSVACNNLDQLQPAGFSKSFTIDASGNPITGEYVIERDLNPTESHTFICRKG